jgi:hypothetical protein
MFVFRQSDYPCDTWQLAIDTITLSMMDFPTSSTNLLCLPSCPSLPDSVRKKMLTFSFPETRWGEKESHANRHSAKTLALWIFIVTIHCVAPFGRRYVAPGGQNVVAFGGLLLEAHYVALQIDFKFCCQNSTGCNMDRFQFDLFLTAGEQNFLLSICTGISSRFSQTFCR